jgi:NAD(P)-dependent dehydrogenase (short-subunit alcohol dehydrogenase family)
MKFLDKRVLVTGGGAGIGRAICRSFESEGALVAVLDLKDEQIAETRSAFRAPESHLSLVADVGAENEMVAAFSAIEREWKNLDVLVVNAGINGVWCPLPELTIAEWERTMRTNLFGTFLTVKLGLSLLRDGGAIIVVSSINGSRTFSNTGASAYATSKAGQIAFAKMMALELAKRRIRVNVVCPGAIKTDIARNTTHRSLESIRHAVEFPEGDVPLTGGIPGTAEGVADAVLFLASQAASHITGTEIFIDGGQSLIL